MPEMIDTFLWVAVGTAALCWLAGFAALYRIPSLRTAQKLRDRLPPVSVIVPARNEEHRLGPLLATIADQDAEAIEIIVVDDQSVDGTAALAKAAGARVVPAGPRPEGWTGKNWACHTGASAASCELLLFLDADTRLYPEAVSRLVHTWQEQGGVVSVQPYHLVDKPYEQLSAFFNLIVMIGVDSFGLFSKRGRPAGAFGPCILCSKRDYVAIGGHESVRGHVVDDMAIAAEFLRHGIEVFCYGGRGAVDFQMYPDGLRALEEGWTKNLSTAAGMSGRTSVCLLASWMTGMFAALFLLVASGSGLFDGFLPYALVIYAAYVAQILYQLRRVGSFRPYVAGLFPIYLGYFQHLFARSIYLTRVRGTVRWKGRNISVGH